MITEDMKKQLQDELSIITEKYDPKREWLKIVILDIKGFHNMRVRDAAELVYDLLLSPIRKDKQ